MPPPFHLSFHEHGNSNRSFHVRQKDVGRMRVGRARREFATISFFVLLSFVAKSWTEEGGERSFVDPSPPRLSLAHIALGSDTTGIRIRVSSPEIPGVSGRIGSRRRRPFRETGVIGVQTGNITPTNPFTDFFLSWMEFKRFRSTCYSPRFLHFRSSLSILFRDQINVRTKQLN